jgi:mannose-6-phosphate isomerase
MDLCPLVFEPRLLNKLWGGRRLASLGKALPAAAAVGESWEVYDDEQGSAPVSQGPAAGLTLRQLSAQWGERLVGPGRAGWVQRFPLLIKLLDASADLSVQVHPDDALAAQLAGPAFQGKSEVFVVLAADPGARMLSGFKPGVDAAAVRVALAAGALEPLLNAVPVAAGDVLDIPAGRPHGIGAGCLVAEVQQNSELTYRLWDYQRLENGQPRELHVEQALRSLRFDEPFASDSGLRRPAGQDRGWAVDEPLVDGPHFSLRRLGIRSAFALPAADRPRLLMVLQGQLDLAWGAGAGMMVPAGATALLPAALAAQAAPGAAGAQALWIEPR